MLMAQIVYKIVSQAHWAGFEATGVFSGATIDLVDGYIHLSTGSQVRETAAKHFAGQNDLILVAVAGDKLGDALKFEVSRGNDLFPHFYGQLQLKHVLWSKPLVLDVFGKHVFPEIL